MTVFHEFPNVVITTKQVHASGRVRIYRPPIGEGCYNPIVVGVLFLKKLAKIHKT